MNKLASPKIVALAFGVLVVSFAIGFYVFAWQEPTEAPPEGNVPTPLNVGLESQTKEGGLILNTGGAEKGLIVDQGSICFGEDCRDSWPSGMVLMGTSTCPAGYFPVLYHYAAQTFTARWCPEACNIYWVGCICWEDRSCTTESGWDTGRKRDIVYLDCIPYNCSQRYLHLFEAPSCFLQIREWNQPMEQCFSTNIDGVICLPE